jgi:malic enzyme
VVGQANNIFIFPGVGLGLVAGKARQVTDEMFLTAAETLARLVTPERLAAGALYPPLSELRRVSHAIAVEVLRLSTRSALSDSDLDAWVSREVWYPAYQAYRPT